MSKTSIDVCFFYRFTLEIMYHLFIFFRGRGCEVKKVFILQQCVFFYKCNLYFGNNNASKV